MLIAVACYGLGAFWGGLEGAVMGGVVFAGAYLSTAVLVHLVVRRRLAASAT